jgi:hypothetical protein
MLKSLLRAVLLVAVVSAMTFSPVSADPPPTVLTSTGLACEYASGYPGFTPTPIACSGAWLGNNLNQTALVQAEIESLWGTGWTRLGTTNTNDANGPFKMYGDDINDGTLELKTPFTGMFILILKTAKAYSIYNLGAVTGLTTIDFVTDGVSLNAQGKPQGLSHATAWTQGTTVPEPSTVILLGTGLLAVGLVGYRRRQD